MKKLRLTLLLLSVAAPLFAAGMPTVNVLVADAGGKLAYKGTTNAKGLFATQKLAPGDYTVQFTSKDVTKSNKYALIVSAGRQKVTATDIEGGKFAGGGVAMRVKVGKDLNITGQVSQGGMATAANGANVKVVKGKRMVWVTGGLGSHLGGHWVEEGSPEANNVQNISRDSVGRLQDRGSGSLGGN